MQILGFAPRGY